jgi:hypothetical protein
MTTVISGTSGFIADFSNATISSRQAFQTSTTNGTTGIYALPNGTSTAASWQATNAADPTNASKILIATNGSTDVQLVSGINGTGTYLPLTFYTNGAEKMRLDTSGNLLVGTTSSSLSASNRGVIEVNGTADTALGFKVANALKAFVYTSATEFRLDASGIPITFDISSSEKARIDTSGNLLVGTTTLPSTSGAGVQIYNNSGQAGRLNIGKGTSGLFNAIANYYSGTYVGGVNYDNTSTSFPTSSDIRLKKDIVDAGSASAKIDQIRIVSHGWKHDDAVVEFGVIAQELVNVAPQAVAVGDIGEEIETTWGVDYSKLVPMLIKAHQEQQALITQLQADVALLKGKA